MIADLKPYPAMKDSGVEWLGEVPGHWEVSPNRALFTEVKDRGHPEEQMLSVTITRGVICQQELLADSSKKDASNQDKSAYKLVQPGDIAYNKMRAWQGAVGASDYQGIISPAYVVQRPREGVGSYYLHYLLRIPAFAKEAERWSYGITSDMWSLRPEHFKMIYTCIPPLPEQAAIVRYLDYADRRIQRYIRAKQKLIHAAGGAEAGHHPPRRHGQSGHPHRPALSGLQALRRGVARGRAGALEGMQASAMRVSFWRHDPQHGRASLLGWFGSLGDTEGHEASCNQ